MKHLLTMEIHHWLICIYKHIFTNLMNIYILMSICAIHAYQKTFNTCLWIYKLKFSHLSPLPSFSRLNVRSLEHNFSNVKVGSFLLTLNIYGWMERRDNLLSHHNSKFNLLCYDVIDYTTLRFSLHNFHHYKWIHKLMIFRLKLMQSQKNFYAFWVL